MKVSISTPPEDARQLGMPPPADPAVAARSLLARLAGLALAYVLLTLPVLLVNAAQGYALPLWPATGLALAALAAGGWRLWPGVWLGALVAECLLRLQLGNTLAWPELLAQSALIAGGDALQAVLGALLVRRVFANAEPLATASSTLRFLVLGGPVSCLIAATVGVAALRLIGGLPGPELPGEWLTWWVGDSLGVLLFAPLVLLVLPETRRHWRARVLQISVQILVTGVLLLGGYALVSRVEQAVPQQRINRPDATYQLPGLAGERLPLEIWDRMPWQAGHSETEYVYLLGSVLFALLSVTFILTAAGQSVRVAREVARRTEELRASEAYNRSIVDSNPDCLKLISLDSGCSIWRRTPAA